MVGRRGRPLDPPYEISPASLEHHTGIPVESWLDLQSSDSGNVVVRNRGECRVRTIDAGNDAVGRKSSLLQKQAYSQLRQLIVSGHAPPGSFLSERQLAAQMGMSKTPVHVALERLQAEGFIDVSPQQGIVVREMSIQDIVEHYELRQAVESYVVTKLSGRLTAEQIKRLKDVLTRHKKAVKTGDHIQYVVLDSEFHLLLCEFLNNRQITQTLEQLRDKIHQVIQRVTNLDRNRIAEALAEHAAIAEAMIDGNTTSASRLLIEHLEIGKQRILNPRRL
jgi:DNA-binding GntR family transcriptional regulator